MVVDTGVARSILHVSGTGFRATQRVSETPWQGPEPRKESPWTLLGSYPGLHLKKNEILLLGS